MSSQDDGGYASVTERWMENARKETPYTELGFGTPVAPEVRQVQRGGIQVGGAANLKGSCHSGHQQSLPCGIALSLLPDLPFLQEELETQIS